jgi:hypothetical protein
MELPGQLALFDIRPFERRSATQELVAAPYGHIVTREADGTVVVRLTWKDQVVTRSGPDWTTVVLNALDAMHALRGATE